MSILFISDLHLDSERPAAIQQFLRFIEQDASKADALYILGDLFEVWIGDDNKELGNTPVIEALTKLKLRGVPCFFMHGNRDFLLLLKYPYSLVEHAIEDLVILKKDHFLQTYTFD